MGYDEVDRLVSVNAPNPWGNAAYTYDALDNLTGSTLGGATARSTTHQFDSATNRLTGITSSAGAYNLSYGYDVRGNITQRGAQAYVFDVGNRMSSATGKATYTYDAHGRRVKVVESNGTNRIQVYDQAGQLRYAVQTGGPNPAVTTKYIYLNRHVLAEVAGATVQYSHSDALGSPVARTSAAAAVLSRTRYEPYGMTAAGINPSGIGFTGHVNDTNTGLVYMQQRYYDPVAGRFLSIDPVAANTNNGNAFTRYNYANNNPYKYVDPDGRAVDSVTVDKDKNVTIVIGISYKGAISPAQATALNNSIAKAYGGQKGKYNVSVSIIPAEKAKLGNYVNVVAGQGQSETLGIGARQATLYTKDPAGASMAEVMQHEAGHFMDIGDRYNKTTGVPAPGYEKNVMGSAKGGKVDERNIQKILDRFESRNTPGVGPVEP